QAGDGAGGTSTQTFTITVTNVNPTTPTDSDSAANSVAEGAANGTTVGITAASTDDSGVTYTLAYDAAGRCAINASTGMVAVPRGTLRTSLFPSTPLFRSQAGDGAGGTSTQSFTIAVTNVNPSTLTDSDSAANRVAEGAANGTT